MSFPDYPGDERVAWMAMRMRHTFKYMRDEKFISFIKNDSFQSRMTSFLDDAEQRFIQIVDYDGKGHLKVIDTVSTFFRGKVMLFYKILGEEVSTLKDMENFVLYGDVQNMDTLQFLDLQVQEIFVPLLQNTANQEEWSSMIAKNVMEDTHKFAGDLQVTVGRTLGETRLPLPPQLDAVQGDVTARITYKKKNDMDQNKSSPSHKSSTNSNTYNENISNSGFLLSKEPPKKLKGMDKKEMLHLVEGCVIRWTKLMQIVVHPEDAFNDLDNPHPGPLTELYFWRDKAVNLNSIFVQLQSSRIRKVLRFMDDAKSTYNSSFAKLCKSVFKSRAEANDNARFLSPLKKWFSIMETSNFSELSSYFRPVVHVLLLIWKNSRCYNTPPRMVVIVKQICNMIIEKATIFLDVTNLFDMLENRMEHKAIDDIKKTIKICGTFKSDYFAYKARSMVECPRNPWIMNNSALFTRLDDFLERCHDVLDLVQAVAQFSELAEIQIGGSRGNTLSTSVHQIYLDFQSSVSAFFGRNTNDSEQANNDNQSEINSTKSGEQSSSAVASSDLLNVDGGSFDDTFYIFRTTVKELEQRLGCVLTKSFEDTNTIMSKFKLLQCFSMLLSRPVIETEMETNYIELLNSYHADLRLVNTIFFDKRLSPPVENNYPPIAGALAWSKGLLNRIERPMTQLRQLRGKLLDRDEALNLVKLYSNLVASISEFENKCLANWGTNVASSSQKMLKNTLLRWGDYVCDDDDVDTDSIYGHGGNGVKRNLKNLFVNFDPALVEILREIKYFLLLGLSVPSAAMQIHQKAEIFRRQTSNLQLVANMYNMMQKTLLPVERPLVAAALSKVDRELEAGLVTLNWKSAAIDDFISQSMDQTSECNDVVHKMKTNLRLTQEILDEWSLEPLFQHGNKPATVTEFNDEYDVYLLQRYGFIRKGGKRIHFLIRETNKKLKVSTGLGDWKAYVDFINAVVYSGLCKLATVSLKYLSDQLSSQQLLSQEKYPLLEIEMDLYGDDIAFLPSIHSNKERNGILNIVLEWVEGFLVIGKRVKRLDSSVENASFIKGMSQDPGIRHLICDISDSVEQARVKCYHFRDKFQKYQYLWETDSIHLFNEFLKSATKEHIVYLKKKKSAFEEDDKASDSDDNSDTIDDSNNPQEAPNKSNDINNLEVLQNTENVQSISTPKNTEKLVMKLLDLEQFDERIIGLRAKASEIEKLEDRRDVYFLRVNAQPIKQALATFIAKWIMNYTSYLYDYVLTKLQSMCDFMVRSHRGLAIDVPDDDEPLLVATMRHIRNVRRSMAETSRMFEPLRNCVELLSKHGVNFCDESITSRGENGMPEMRPPMPVEEYLTIVPHEWDDTVNAMYKRREIIQPIQNRASDELERKMKIFSSQLDDFNNEMYKKAPFDESADTCTAQTAYETIHAYHTHILELEEQSEELLELADLFELPVSSFAALEQSRTDIGLLKQCWDISEMVKCFASNWSVLRWENIDSSEVIDIVSFIQEQLKGLPKHVNDWKVFKQVSMKLHEFEKLMPLIEDLQTNAMQDRHWQSLFAVTGRVGNKVNTLSEALELELHRRSDDVCEIVDLAKKEQNIDSELLNIEQVWEVAELEFVKYKGSNVFTLNVTTEQIECLEEHQMQLQGMISMGRYADFFRGEIEHWQHVFADVATTMILWNQLSMKWISLQPIFTSSGDIQTQLPEQTSIFESIDKKFKILCEDGKAEPNIVQACRVEGRCQIIKDMLAKLEGCEKALEDYLDVKKNKFPRFYFLSNDVLLEILSNASDPSRVAEHLPACFTGIAGLLLDITIERPPGFEEKEAALAAEVEAAAAARTLEMNAKRGMPVVPVAKKTKRALLEEKEAEERREEEIREKNKKMEEELARLPRSYVATAILGASSNGDPEDRETIELQRSLKLSGAPESWLKSLDDLSKITLKDVLMKSHEKAASWDVDMSRQDWLFKFPAQIVLLAAQVYWTMETESVLDELEAGQDDSATNYLEICNSRLQALIKLVLGDLSLQSRTKIVALITQDVHNRDIIQKICDYKPENANDFLWQSQLRIYCRMESRQVTCNLCDYETLYFFEYIGNCSRLVITPLTDRCYITLTMALQLTLGGAPAGPAGTGKTETTKDLARALGLPCMVFNCSDQMSYISIGGIFKGLSQCGAWGCFDEFNRIPIEVLSVVATQIQCVLNAIRLLSNPKAREQAYANVPEGRPPVVIGRFDFTDGTRVKLVPTVGFFITMNPGYEGRTELPENVKTHFRSCAMIRPDLAPICENMLMAEGFQKARELSIKFVTLYNLAEQLLSKQHHYDWGLRAVKCILQVAGRLKREAENEVSEDVILMRALRDFNIAKIPNCDVAIFRRLVSDIFPRVDASAKENPELMRAVQQCCDETGLTPDPEFFDKVGQLDELLKVRHSVVVMGPPGSGKTEIWKCLAHCFNQEKYAKILDRLAGHATSDEDDKNPNPNATSDEDDKKVDVSVSSAFGHNKKKNVRHCVYETINPKAVQSHELYGYISRTGDWEDGALSNVIRNMSKSKTPYSSKSIRNKWVILDGDIDALWIESMNTVMDDNKVLTLVSNERIPVTSSMRLILETENMNNATPATVSRVGILYINAEDVGWLPFMERWISSLKCDDDKEYLTILCDRYILPILKMIKDNKLKPCVALSELNMVTTLCSILDALFATYPFDMINKDVLESMFLFACMWGFGGNLVIDKGVDQRLKFSELWLETFSEYKITKFKLRQGAETIFDFFFKVENNIPNVCEWKSEVPDFSPSGDLNDEIFSEIVVPTVDNCRLNYLLSLLVGSSQKPVMLAGVSGTGKTTIAKQYLESLKSDKMISSVVNLNFYTTSLSLQRTLESKLDKRSGSTYGPPASKQMLYFIDDLNMPQVEKYGTQTPCALLRQWMDYQSWYDRDDLKLKKNIVNIQFMCGMNPKAGSFFVNPRLQRHFAIIATELPAESDLMSIYGQILDISLTENNVNNDVRSMGNVILGALFKLVKSVQVRFLASAVKFHYNFSMREISSVVEGLCLATPKHISSPASFVRLYLHECYRVFSDRMIDEYDTKQFYLLLVEHTRQKFDEMNQEILQAEPLIFTSFIKKQGSKEKMLYAPISSGKSGWIELDSSLKKLLSNYNDRNNIMDIVLFQQAAEHITRICRILSRPRGNALLVGVGGSGKQSLCKLSAFICGYKIFQLSQSAQFGEADLREYLKKIYFKAAIKPAVPLVFLITDSQITDEKFLVLINGILTSGYFPGLFSKEELEDLFSNLRPAAKAAMVKDTWPSLLNFFITRVRSNLHVVLGFSPMGPKFRTRARQFPGIISCTTMDWFHPWSSNALVSVANSFLKRIDFGEKDAKSEEAKMRVRDMRENMAHHMATVHLSVSDMCEVYYTQQRRHNYVTPSSFLELIKSYTALLTDKGENLRSQEHRLAVGLNTLAETEKNVRILREDLRKNMDIVTEKREKVEVLLTDMGQQKNEATELLASMDTIKTVAAEQARRAGEIENKSIVELAAAKPAMDAAKKAVHCLSKPMLVELKSLATPPEGVDQVTNAVMMLLTQQTKDLTWDKAKKMMAKVDKFKKQLEAFSGDSIPQVILNKLMPIVSHQDFTPGKMKKKSEAAANLCNWVVNIVKFHEIYKNVKPLMNELKSAQEKKRKADRDLNMAKNQVSDVNLKLEKLKDLFLRATLNKAEVESAAKRCKDRLSLATRLTSGLSDEKDRWSKDVENLKQSALSLVGDCILGAAFVSYIGAFDGPFREILLKQKWLPDLLSRDIPLTENISPVNILSTAAVRAEWSQQGLKADQMSLQNGAIITNCQRWPLLIDPQMQGISWLKNRGTHVLLQFTQKRWLSKLTTCISNGTTVIIEGVEDQIDLAMTPVLQRSFYRKGRNLYISMGETSSDNVLYDKDFRLYLQTKRSNPHFQPEVTAQCTVINCIVTSEGLEEQLMAAVVRQEEPHLEEQKEILHKKFTKYKIKLLALENDLLERLSNAPSDILSDVSLIEGLEETKATAVEVEDALQEGKKTEAGINNAREVYRIVANEGSSLFFLISRLHRVNHMYRYSLNSFMVFFFHAINTVPLPEGLQLNELDEEEKAERVLDIRENVRLIIFNWINRGLFQRDQFTFLTLLFIQLLNAGIIGTDCGFSAEGLRFLINCPRSKDEENEASEALSQWLPESALNSIEELSKMSTFEGLRNDMEENSTRFKEWYNKISPEREKLPSRWRSLDGKLFQKLLVLRCLRPDRIQSAITDLIMEFLPSAEKYTSADAELSPDDILAETFNYTTPITPMFFILSPGVDIVNAIDRFAGTKGRIPGKTYFNISLGQGQGKSAIRKLDDAIASGHWVLLNNIHLMPSWLEKLEKKLLEMSQKSATLSETSETVDNDNTIDSDSITKSSNGSVDATKFGSSNDFRLFLSSDQSESIPVALLCRSIKLSNEPPSGLKANLSRSFRGFSKEDLDNMDNATRGILFSLCYFHAVLVERKKFGKQGFNMKYPFSSSDLHASVSMLRHYMEAGANKLPWRDLRYIFGEIMYGGHIVNEFDRKLCNTYLLYFIQPKCLDELELVPYLSKEELATLSFKAPRPTTYANYLNHIESIPAETPYAFGLHSNAAIGFRTTQCENLFKRILDLRPKETKKSPNANVGEDDIDNSSSDDSSISKLYIAESTMQDILDIYRDSLPLFPIEDLRSLVNPIGKSGKKKAKEISPFSQVFFQECVRAENLVTEIVQSLVSLEMAFNGELTMTSTMDKMIEDLYNNDVPNRWKVLAYASLRSLTGWIVDLNKRIEILHKIVDSNLELPPVTWLPGLFSPQSFLTAILQRSAKKSHRELDKLGIDTIIMKRQPADISKVSRDGAYVFGLVLQGARWDQSAASLASSKPKEMFCELPVINLKAGLKSAIESKGNMYHCPVYRTKNRGSSYVFTANLRSKLPAGKWTLASVVMLMDSEG